VVRSFDSLDNAIEPFSVIEIAQGHRPQPAGTRMWQKLNIYAVCSASLPLENVEKLSIRGEGQFRAGWSRDAMKLFEVLSPTLGEIETFGNHLSSGVVEALTAPPTWNARSLGSSPARSQLPNLGCLRLVGVDLEGHMEDAGVPFHRLLRYCMESRRDAVPRFGIRRLKKLEISSRESYGSDDKSLVMVDLYAVRELVNELCLEDSAACYFGADL